MFEFAYSQAADAAMDMLESNSAMSAVLEAVQRTLDRLSADPYDRRLGTTAYQTQELGGVSATPIRLDDWYIFWQRGPEPKLLEIVLIHELRAD